MTGEPPFVSVVVPTAGRPQVLGACLESLRAQDYPAGRFEILVVHNGAASGSRPDEPPFRHLRLPRRDANAARNRGIAAALGDPICLVDDDVVAPRGWLRALVDGFLRHPHAECAGGPVRPLYYRAAPRACARHADAGSALDYGDAEEEVSEVWGCNMAVRRAAVERVGPFREGMARAQEWEWEHRLLRTGGTIVYVPGAWLTHRRLPDDLRAGRLVVDAFLRGYIVGQNLPRRRPHARRALEALAHARHERCTWGLRLAAKAAGEALGGAVARAGGLR
jgi:GT2 family glycosyltransferase